MSNWLKYTYNISVWPRWGLNFVGLPKTGNTMMKWYLLGQPYKGEPMMFVSVDWIHDPRKATYITPEQANKNGFRTFSLIRHPYERIISLYADFYDKRKHRQNIGPRNLTFDEFLDQVILPSQDMPSTNIHLRSMHYFLKDLDDPILIELDHLEECRWLKKRLGVDHFDKIHTTKMKFELTPEQKRKIDIRYKDDFGYFI